ncbi:hypothetical protein ACFW4M_19685 [Streptomyces sp. NPDC058794]|uniref:hypothetical protein n=1 Tax=unclassified Streptomyces TaxID=2593676 RepID=UPI003699E7D3
MIRRRPTLLTALTLTAAAALTLSACGGDDSAPGDNDKIAGADTGSSSPSVSPSPRTSDTGGRPDITFPSDAKNVFEYEKTGDATKDAALRDSTLSVDSVDEAIFKGSTDTEALGYYNTESALNDSITYVLGYVDKKNTWVGETRYFDYKVNIVKDGQAYVTYCSDESKSFIKDKKTGKVEETPTSSDSYVLYNTKLTKNNKDVWQTTDIASDRGSEACQP